MDYQSYLASDEWKAKRTKVRRRARGWCERCKVRPRADIHHLSYANIGNEAETELIAVCHSCHAFLHGKRQHDPICPSLSAAEISIARELLGCHTGGDIGAQMIRGLCKNFPAHEAVRIKLGIQV